MKNNEVEEAANVAWLKAKRQVAELIDSPRKESLLKIVYQLGFTAGIGHASERLAPAVTKREGE